jgi:hypothetical protein
MVCLDVFCNFKAISDRVANLHEGERDCEELKSGLNQSMLFLSALEEPLSWPISTSESLLVAL